MATTVYTYVIEKFLEITNMITSLTIRVGHCVHAAPCIATRAARARLGVRLGDRRDRASAQARFRASAVCRCEGIG